ncbi:MAG: nucleotidyltransferase domain-containing protein [Muribaculaceae bacterium]|nr:nucleotidyltransferase domain-containing protein [Muribaculaceae bacterium]MDE6195179.1 nucleotidyltransferase domain-containing protein [Muribaculaceae bacterium]
MYLITDNLHRLFNLCKKYNVRKLYAFGSILTSRFNDQSDVDILVDFNSEIDHDNYADNYFDFYYALKNLFGRDVDLVDEMSVKNPYFKEELEETKYLIYG